MRTPETILEAAGARWDARQLKRSENLHAIENNTIIDVEEPERIRKRINHLSDIHKQSIESITFYEDYSLIKNIGLERVIGDSDFLSVGFLENGLAVARSVCRINIYTEKGQFDGYGTGFLVSPSLIMTNNHALPTTLVAQKSIVEFDYQLAANGAPLSPKAFQLDPSSFFITNEDLDFTIVGVIDVDNLLPSFGWNKLIGEGKALIGDPLNIIQHPNGGYKQVVLQSNELVDLLDVHAHYLTDTEPGSSGAMVCNNQWEVVALHHSGVPEIRDGKIIDNSNQPWDGNDTDDIKWVANEGIRISRILQYIQLQNIPVNWENNMKRLLEDTPPNPLEISQVLNNKILQPKQPKHSHLQHLIWEFPLKIKVSIGIDSTTIQEVEQPSANEPTTIGDHGLKHSLNVLEKKVIPYIDPDYNNRKGFDDKFLNTKIPIPEIIDLNEVSKMDNGEHIIPYHHFSIAMNKERRLAYFCASNVDGRSSMKRPEPGRRYSRDALGGLRKIDSEAWMMDPRIPEKHQLPDKFFNRDRRSFDKGHIVRRDDVAWGSTYEEVRISNGDTFHTTNCSPQVADYNRSNLGGVWGIFENELLKQAENEKLIVFSGPVLTAKDRFFDGYDERGPLVVQIPKSFWKIVVSNAGDSIHTFGFHFSQDLSHVDWKEVFRVKRQFNKFQVSIPDLEKMISNVKFPKVLKETDQFSLN